MFLNDKDFASPCRPSRPTPSLWPAGDGKPRVVHCPAAQDQCPRQLCSGVQPGTMHGRPLRCFHLARRHGHRLHRRVSLRRKLLRIFVVHVRAILGSSQKKKSWVTRFKYNIHTWWWFHLTKNVTYFYIGCSATRDRDVLLSLKRTTTSIPPFFSPGKGSSN